MDVSHIVWHEDCLVPYWGSIQYQNFLICHLLIWLQKLFSTLKRFIYLFILFLPYILQLFVVLNFFSKLKSKHVFTYYYYY